MKFFLVLFLTIFAPCLIIKSYAQRTKVTKITHPSVQLINTQQRTLFSKINNQSYELYISLPDDYEKGNTTYPILYITDANTYFGMMADITRNLQWGGEMPETIIIGIAYPLGSLKPDERWEKWLAWRMHDFTPTNTASIDKDFGMNGIKSGGANIFLQFLEQELFPFVEKNYRASDKNRTYAGFSLGGLFGLYTLFKKPALFNQYLIGSPSIWYDNKYLLQLENEYSKNNADLAAKVFISVGELEEEINSGMVRNMLELTSILKNRKYKSLYINSSVLEGETHMSAPSISFQRGLRYFFRK